MTVVHRSLHAGALLVCAAPMLFGGASNARAEQAPVTVAVGAPLDERERDEASRFCGSTRSDATKGGAERVCWCFVSHWQARSSRLQRLALRITLAPGSHDARATLWTIAQLQGGMHEDLLQKLSDELKTVARDSLQGCER